MHNSVILDSKNGRWVFCSHTVQSLLDSNEFPLQLCFLFPSEWRWLPSTYIWKSVHKGFPHWVGSLCFIHSLFHPFINPLAEWAHYALGTQFQSEGTLKLRRHAVPLRSLQCTGQRMQPHGQLEHRGWGPRDWVYMKHTAYGRQERDHWLWRIWLLELMGICHLKSEKMTFAKEKTAWVKG